MDYLRYYVGNLLLVCGVAGFVLGGTWVWLGAATLPALILADLVAQKPELTTRTIRHPALAELPLYLHALLLAALVVTAAWRVHAGGLSATLAWLGVMPNIPVTYELMHRRSALARFVAFLCTAVIAEPVRRLAHLRGHHVKFGRDDDSDTARRGESIYVFMLRAAAGRTREAFVTERERLAKTGHSVWSWRSDVVRSLALSTAVLGSIWALAGSTAVRVIAIGFVLSRFLLEAFNYLQHHGLVRAHEARFAPRHAWSHLTPVVRAAAFEITNHPHHHMDQQARNWELVPDASAPQMPSALLCFVAALVPPLWERAIAKPRLQDRDARYATPEERELAAKANAGWPTRSVLLARI